MGEFIPILPKNKLFYCFRFPGRKNPSWSYEKVDMIMQDDRVRKAEIKFQMLFHFIILVMIVL